MIGWTRSAAKSPCIRCCVRGAFLPFSFFFFFAPSGTYTLHCARCYSAFLQRSGLCARSYFFICCLINLFMHTSTYTRKNYSFFHFWNFARGCLAQLLPMQRYNDAMRYEGTYLEGKYFHPVFHIFAICSVARRIRFTLQSNAKQCNAMGVEQRIDHNAAYSFFESKEWFVHFLRKRGQK